MRRYLCCSENNLGNSPAEKILSREDGIEVLSAATNNDAETTLSADLIKWADSIFVMERAHRSKVRKRFR